MVCNCAFELMTTWCNTMVNAPFGRLRSAKLDPSLWWTAHSRTRPHRIMLAWLLPCVLSSPSSPPEVCAVVSNHGSCDSVWASHAFTCSYLTSVDWDCSGCNCPGDRLQQHAAPPPPAASSSERRLTISLDAGEPVGSPAGSLPFAIFQSAARGELQEVAKWLRKGGSVDAFSSVSTSDGKTVAFALLHAATCNGHLEIVTVLLKRGASVDLQAE